MNKIADFFKNADNVYSTTNYIVAQKFLIAIENEKEPYVISKDTFFKRNVQRDKQYAKLYTKSLIVTGGRINCPTAKRKYIE